MKLLTDCLTNLKPLYRSFSLDTDKENDHVPVPAPRYRKRENGIGLARGCRMRQLRALLSTPPRVSSGQARTKHTSNCHNGGIGVTLRSVPAAKFSQIEIVSIVPGGPAAAAGLQVGDIFETVDGRALPTYATADDVAGLLLGRPKEPVSMSVRRADGSSASFNLRRTVLKQGQVEARATERPSSGSRSRSSVQSVSSVPAPAPLRHALTSEEEEHLRGKLRRAFDDFDTDKSGKISMTELQNVLLAANVTLSPEGLETLMGNTDSDNDGEISYDEFIDQLQTEFNSGKMGGLVSVVEEASLTYGWLNPMEWFERRRRILRNMDPRQRLRKILNAPKSSRLASALGLIIVGTIIASVFTFFLSTVPSLEDSHVLWSIEVACGIIFTIELLLRTYVATLDIRNMMLLEPMYWIDVITIVPFYMDIFSQHDEGLLVLELLELLRLARIFKLLKHYSGWRVLLIAIENSWRALMVPGFAMLIVTLLLSGALIILERADAHTARRNQTSPGALEPEPIADGFEAMWIVFWVVATLGYDGSYGLEGPAQRVIFAFAIVCGLLFTTMPITVIGEAFRSAWERKEVTELQMQIAIMLEERGLTMSQLHRVFREFDTSGDGQLDWGEFKRAMKTMRLNVPVFKLRQLFALFDEDETGEVDYHEFCRILFPNLDQDTIAADSAADESGECTSNQSEAPSRSRQLGGCGAGGGGEDGEGGDGSSGGGAAGVAGRTVGGSDSGHPPANDGGIPPPRKRLPRRSKGEQTLQQVRTICSVTSAFNSTIADAEGHANRIAPAPAEALGLPSSPDPAALPSQSVEAAAPGPPESAAEIKKASASAREAAVRLADRNAARQAEMQAELARMQAELAQAVEEAAIEVAATYTSVRKRTCEIVSAVASDAAGVVPFQEVAPFTPRATAPAAEAAEAAEAAAAEADATGAAAAKVRAAAAAEEAVSAAAAVRGKSQAAAPRRFAALSKTMSISHLIRTGGRRVANARAAEEERGFKLATEAAEAAETAEAAAARAAAEAAQRQQALAAEAAERAELEAALTIMTTASMASAPQPSSPVPSNLWQKAAADEEKALVEEAAERAIKVEMTERGDTTGELKAGAAEAEAAEAAAARAAPEAAQRQQALAAEAAERAAAVAAADEEKARVEAAAEKAIKVEMTERGDTDELKAAAAVAEAASAVEGAAASALAEAAATEMPAVAEKAAAAVEAVADELVAEKGETAAAGADLASKLKAAKLELSLADNVEERRTLKNKVAELEAVNDELVAEKAETAVAGVDLASKLKAAKLELSLADNVEERRPLKNKVAELEAQLAIMAVASMAASPQSPSLPPSPSNRWRKAASGATAR